MSEIQTSEPVPFCLYDPRRGDLSFKLAPLGEGDFAQPQRSNCFTMLWIRRGSGFVHADLGRFEFHGPVLAFFNPYQICFLERAGRLDGLALQFHANFFCIETYHEAVGCNGVLFNDTYGLPTVAVDQAQAEEFEDLFAKMTRELGGGGLAQPEMLISYLKIFLIAATRLKLAQRENSPSSAPSGQSPKLEQLSQLIEAHFHDKRSPRDYAALLHMTPKALGKLVKMHWGRTLTEVIRERLLKQAKWQLLHTQRPVKEIAWEAGFADEFYFSRVFKRATGLAPTAFREFETSIRSGGNSSMQ